MKINTKNISQNTERFPAYMRYAGQAAPQRAYLTLDKRDGTMDVYVEDIGGGMPEEVWSGDVLRYKIHPAVTRDELLAAIDELRDELTASPHDVHDLSARIERAVYDAMSDVRRVMCEEDVHDIVAEAADGVDADAIVGYIAMECKTHYTDAELRDMISVELDLAAGHEIGRHSS